MAEVIRMPQLSDTMEEGVIAKWHKKAGDKVESGEVLAEVETDKATMEMESFEEGTILHIAKKEGDSVPVDAVIAVIGEKGEDYKKLLEDEQGGEKKEKAAEASSEKKEPEKEKSNKSEKEESSDSKTGSSESESSGQEKKQTAQTRDGRIKASPLAKSMAAENNISLEKLEGSGDNGRIIKRDIERYLSDKPEDAEQAEIAVSEDYEDVKVSQMRKTIAKRLADSKFSAPHFYLNVDINMDEAISSRKKVNEIVGEENKISFNDMIIKSAAMALKKHPQVNASWMGEKIRFYKHVHVGVAIAVEEGLLVPVVRHADQKGMSRISAEVREYAKKAKNKELQPKDWEGNTFTISNLGMFGIDDFTAIINPPDSAIMAVGNIKEQAISVNGEIKSANIMRVTLSCDHRLVDGATGAKFLETFRNYLESPVAMLA